MFSIVSRSSLLGLLFFICTPVLFSQPGTPRDAFAESFIQVFQQRANGFDSIKTRRISGDNPNEFDASIPLAGADRSFINYNSYNACYQFRDSTAAITHFKNLQQWINYAAGAYSAKVIFVPQEGTTHHLQFYLSDTTSFTDSYNLLSFFKVTEKKTDKPFTVMIQIGGNADMAFYTDAGVKLNNAALASLVRDIGFGTDTDMLKIRKGKKSGADEYESSRTLPGYKAVIFEGGDEDKVETALSLVTKWTGEAKTVNAKVDSLILQMKSALPAGYCYRIVTDEQSIYFYQHPFAKNTADANFTIAYGLNAENKKSYYLQLYIVRTRDREKKQEDPALFPFKDTNGKYGYKDGKGKVIVAGKYDKAATFNEGRGCVVLNNRQGFVDATGKEIVPLKYSYVSLFFMGGIAEFEQNNQYGILNRDGKEIVPAIYDDIDAGSYANETYRNKLIRVKKNGKFGFMDSSGKVTIPLQYKQADIIGQGLARVMPADKYGIIDWTGKIVIPAQYDYIGTDDFDETGLMRVMMGKLFGLADQKGKLVIPVKYSDISTGFTENLASAKLNGKWGFIDKTGKEKIPFKYDRVDDFSNGFAGVCVDGKCGFIDKTGKQVVPLKYQDTGTFAEGLAPVKINDKWGYINKTDQLVIPAKYDRAAAFDSRGRAKVHLGNKWGRIDVKGTVIEAITNVDDDDDDGW